MQKLYLLLFILLSYPCFAQPREIAITIDDLPLVGSNMSTPGNQQRATERFRRIIKALVDNQVPATGFVIAGAIAKGQWEFLEEFRNAGFEIGNHSYTHYNLNQVGAEKYIADVDRADKILSPLFSEKKYFRYPYLAEGGNGTRQKVLSYLADHNYTVAPVTIDSKDFRFNEQVYHTPYRAREDYIQRLKSRYLDFIWNQTLKAEKKAGTKPVKHILLIHANILNSYLLDDIIKMYKNNGYTFITLKEALENPAPVITAPATMPAIEATQGPAPVVSEKPEA